MECEAKALRVGAGGNPLWSGKATPPFMKADFHSRAWTAICKTDGIIRNPDPRL